MIINNINLKEKISQVESTLDRNINFITTCDKNASIILAFISILITFYLTSKNISLLKNSKTAISSNKITFIAISIILTISLILLVVGISMFILVLIDKVNVTKKPSLISLTGSTLFYENTFNENSRTYQMNNTFNSF